MAQNTPNAALEISKIFIDSSIVSYWYSSALVNMTTPNIHPSQIYSIACPNVSWLKYNRKAHDIPNTSSPNKEITITAVFCELEFVHSEYSPRPRATINIISDK